MKDEGLIEVLTDSFLESAHLELRGKSIARILPAEIRKDKHYTYFKNCASHSGTQDIIDFFSPRPGIQYLDFGCNINLQRYALYRYPWYYHGLESCELIVRKMQHFIGAKRFKNASVSLSTSLDLPLRDAFFDCCSCIGVLEYYPANQASYLVYEFCRVLKPGGKIILDIPNIRHRAYGLLCKMEAFLRRPVQLAVHYQDFIANHLPYELSMNSVDSSEVMVRLYLQKKL